MFSSSILSLLTVSAVLAAPGRYMHQHHRRDDVIVYQTVMVTEWHTITAGQEQTSASAAAALPVTSAAAVALFTTPVTTAAASPKTTLQTSAVSAAAATTTAATSTTNKVSGSKRGIAWPSSNPTSWEAPFLTSSSPLSWYFNWGTGATSGLSSLTHIYQQWGSSNLNNLNGLPAGSVLLGFNEPDLAGQSTMTPAAAAAIYKSNLTPLRKSGQISYLGSPATTNGGTGLPWLTEFMSLCSDCEIDFISQHWYGPTLSLLQSQVTAVHTAFGLPVWLTEFACTNWNAATNPSVSEVQSFLTSATAWLDQTSWVEKYAWFGFTDDAALGTQNRLLTSDGTALSALGQLYM